MDDRKIYSVLAFAGVMPFLACAFLLAAGIDSMHPVGRFDQLAADYGLAIICFLTGIHWATQLYAKPGLPFNLFVISNVIFLAVWLTCVVMSLDWALASELVAFPVLLGIDVQLQRNGLISSHYLRTRLIATVLACLSLLFILLSA